MENSQEYEWCIMHYRYLDEPHRGPMTEFEAREWIKEAEAVGVHHGAFYLARREVGPWTLVETI